MVVPIFPNTQFSSEKRPPVFPQGTFPSSMCLHWIANVSTIRVRQRHYAELYDDACAVSLNGGSTLPYSWRFRTTVSVLRSYSRTIARTVYPGQRARLLPEPRLSSPSLPMLSATPRSGRSAPRLTPCGTLPLTYPHCHNATDLPVVVWLTIERPLPSPAPGTAQTRIPTTRCSPLPEISPG